MNWMINLTLLLLITTLSGSLALMIWLLAKWILLRNGYLQWCYKGLWIVTLFYLVPVAYTGMVFVMNSHPVWGGVLFLPTPVLLNVCRLAVALWLPGVAVMVFRLLGDVRSFRRLQRVCTPCRQWEQELFIQVCESLKIPANKIRLCRSRGITIPSFGGILHPVVLIPEIDFTKEQLHTVLLHELIHHKQRAFWLVMAARIVKVTQYFNPLAWILGFLVEKWCEFSCDGKACVQVGSRKNYFSNIIDVLEKTSGSDMAVAIYLTKSRHDVVERMQHMKKFGQKKKRSFGVMALLVIFLMGTYSLTVAAASNGIGDLYQRCYGLTVVEIEEGEAVITVEEAEYLEEADEGSEDGIIIDGDMLMRESKSGNLFEWTVPSGYMERTAAFHVEAGQEIYINAWVEQGDRGVKVGIVDPSGTRRYVWESNVVLVGTSESIDYYIQSHMIDEGMCYLGVYRNFVMASEGTYYVFVENTNLGDVQVKGSYKVR